MKFSNISVNIFLWRK